MAISNHERVGKSLNLLKDGLRPFVEREMQAFYRSNWVEMVKETFRDSRLGGDEDPMGDVAALLVIMDRHWGNVFRSTLGRAGSTPDYVKPPNPFRLAAPGSDGWFEIVGVVGNTQCRSP